MHLKDEQSILKIDRTHRGDLYVFEVEVVVLQNRSEYHTQLGSSKERVSTRIFDLTAGVYFVFIK